MDQTNPEPDYSFLESNQESSGYFDFFTKADKKTRTKMIGFGGGILLLVLLVVGLLFSGGSDDLQTRLITVAQKQNEIIRITEIGEDKARSQEILTVSIVTKASMGSAQNQIKGVVSGSISNEVLRRLESSQTTNELNSAEQANRFDEIYLEILEAELESYLASLETAGNRASGNTLQLLDRLYREGELILSNLQEI